MIQQVPSMQKNAEIVASSLIDDDPRCCAYCGEPFALVIGCHKVCRCGYQEGCGD